MKKLFFIIIFFLGFVQVIQAANVYFEYPLTGDAYYSNEDGYAKVDYHVLEPSPFFYSIGDLQIRHTNENGAWSDRETKSYWGYFNYTYSGNYSIQARIWVYWDLGGHTNYWIYSNVITFTVIDEMSPATPANFSSEFQDGHPHFSWDANTELDLKNYKIAKKSDDEMNYSIVAILSSNVTDWTDYTVSPATIGNKIYYHYKIMAEDVNSNSSSYSDPIAIAGSDLLEKSNTTNIVNNELFPNFPNPFNPTTKINFSVKNKTHVNLTVYNLLGENVATLVNNNLDKGMHSVEFNALNLPSGTYFYILRIGNNFVETRKMLLLK